MKTPVHTVEILTFTEGVSGARVNLARRLKSCSTTRVDPLFVFHSTIHKRGRERKGANLNVLTN